MKISGLSSDWSMIEKATDIYIGITKNVDMLLIWLIMYIFKLWDEFITWNIFVSLALVSILDHSWQIIDAQMIKCWKCVVNEETLSYFDALSVCRV
jgi:hypothetical protein